MTQSQVRLTINEAALRKSLRHAFANHDTCVQELLQNARRAGATRIYVDYDAKTKTLKVDDDGCGISDFNALMTVGNSGWNSETAASEKPYGMGFLGSLYACEHVSIQTNGKVLSFSTAAALDDAVLDIKDAPQDETMANGTIVTLVGFEWANHEDAIKKMACGFAVPIIFGGVVLARPDACTDEFVSIAAGRCRLSSRTEFQVWPRIYLQGFCVYDKHPSTRWFQADVVHLDSTLYFGKFPDRDKVIDQEQMVADVKRQIHALCTEHLLQMKQDLAPAEFCRVGYKLARALGRLDVFNDVPVLPRDWFGVVTSMPREWPDRDQPTDQCDPGEITAAEVESGAYHVATLLPFEAGDIDEDGMKASNNRGWLYAYATRSLVPLYQLGDDHWIYKVAQIKSNSDIDIECSPALHQGEFDRSNWISRVTIEVVESAAISKDGERRTVDQAFYDMERDVVVVPMVNGRPAEIGDECLCQIVDYMDDEQFEEDDLYDDQQAINDFVRKLVADTAEERVELTMAAMLRGDRSLRGKRFTLEIGHDGRVKVDQLVNLPAAAQAVANQAIGTTV
jgi:hypothetical protein